MAHELEMVEGKAQMFSVKKTPWHGLGVILNDAPTSEDAIVAAGLNWTVSKRQVSFQDRIDQSMKRVDGDYAIVRDSDERCLGRSGESWQPLQNKDAFKFFDPFVESGEASYETAGSLDEGRRIWVMAKVNRDPITIVKGDDIEKYILLSNRHSAGFAVTGALTPIRVVCANTEAMAYRNQNSKLFKATHSMKMAERLEAMQATIAQADAAFEESADFYRRFAKKQIKQADIIKFMGMTFQWDGEPKEGRETTIRQNKTDTIMRLMETGQGSDIAGVKGTVWGLYNSVTEFVAHENGKNDAQRLNNAWFGLGMTLNQRAFEAAKLLVA